MPEPDLGSWRLQAMNFTSPMFRKFLAIGFVPAVAALVFVDLYLSGRSMAGTLASRLIAATCIAVFGIFLLVCVAAWIESRLFSRRVARLCSFANSLAGSPAPSLDPLDTDEGELSALAGALKKAAVRWQDVLERLRSESARTEAVLASLAEGVVAVDKDLRVIFSNGSFAQVMRAASPLKTRMPLYDLSRDPALAEMLGLAIKSGDRVKRTLTLAAAGNRVFEIHAAPFAERRHEGAIAILHDITELERLERIRKDFVANVSHELRTPLTAIRGYAETLLDGAADDPAQNRRFLEIILAHAVRLNNIASDLLVLSELESRRKQPELNRLSIIEVIEAALRTVEAEARLRGVVIKRGELKCCHMMGSKGRLEQAVVNLLDNAIKFNHPGGFARVDAGPLGNEKVFITIADNGSGIPSGDLARIFERFYRVDKARSREVGGTGLGLSIVKHVVERMGGTVQVESQLGKGSAFKLLFPAAPAESSRVS